MFYVFANVSVGFLVCYVIEVNIFFFQIRAKLVSKQATEERLEKVRKLRELKKFGKKVQQEVNIKRAKEKREMLDQVIHIKILIPRAQ